MLMKDFSTKTERILEHNKQKAFDTICTISENPQKAKIVRQFEVESRKPNDLPETKSLLLDYTKGYQTDNIHLYLSDLMIASLEELKWNKLKLCINFESAFTSENVYFEIPIEELNREMNSICEPSTSLSHIQNLVFHESQNTTNLTLCSPTREGNSIFYTEFSHPNPTTTTTTTTTTTIEGKETFDVQQNKFEETADKNLVIIKALQNYGKRESSSSRRMIVLASCARNPQNLVLISNDLINSTIGLFSKNHKLTTLPSPPSWSPLKKAFIFDFSNVISKDLSALISYQNNRCAGCGIKFNDFSMKRSRFCNYYSRMFCNCCFQGNKARIPAQILHFWNFRNFYASDAAVKFLKDNEDQPVFDIQAINPHLYIKAKLLRKARDIRIQLSHMWQYLQMCGLAEHLQTTNGYLLTMFSSIPKRFFCLDNVNIFSMIDFENIVNRNFFEIFDPLVYTGTDHIKNCRQCQQRAFLCQMCPQSSDLLFPFQLDKVYRCEDCGALSHLQCYEKELKLNADLKCPKCERIRIKRLTIE